MKKKKLMILFITGNDELMLRKNNVERFRGERENTELRYLSNKVNENQSTNLVFLYSTFFLTLERTVMIFNYSLLLVSACAMS